MKNDFDFQTFKNEFDMGDIWGLNYIGKTIIKDMEENNKNVIDITKEDYIINLFKATICLNTCNDIYETTDKARDFNYDLYYNTRDLLLKELGLSNVWD